MIGLLDVNVLIALIDEKHEGQETALFWFKQAQIDGWATCPITENGVIRIVSGSRYPNRMSLQQTLALVGELRHLPGHVFLPDDLSLFDSSHFGLDRLSSTSQITDVYLLGLAVANQAQFITFDQHIDITLVAGGRDALIVLK